MWSQNNKRTGQKDCRDVWDYIKYTKMIVISDMRLSLRRGDFLPSSVQNHGFLRPVLIVAHGLRSRGSSDFGKEVPLRKGVEVSF